MKNMRTYEDLKNDRAEMEMKKSGDEIMRKSSEEKAESKNCDCEYCDCENCDCVCCCSDEK